MLRQAGRDLAQMCLPRRKPSNWVYTSRISIKVEGDGVTLTSSGPSVERLLQRIPETADPATPNVAASSLLEEVKGATASENANSVPLAQEDDAWMQMPLADPAIKLAVTCPPHPKYRLSHANTPPRSSNASPSSPASVRATPSSPPPPRSPACTPRSKRRRSPNGSPRRRSCTPCAPTTPTSRCAAAASRPSTGTPRSGGGRSLPRSWRRGACQSPGRGGRMRGRGWGWSWMGRRRGGRGGRGVWRECGFGDGVVWSLLAWGQTCAAVQLYEKQV